MIDVEATLAAVLEERAGRIEPARNHRGSTLRGARRRRVAAVVGAAVMSVAVVAGTVGAVRALDDTPSVRATGPDAATESSGPYGFESRSGEYPFVATGTFRNADWGLRVAVVSPGDPRVRITFEMERRGRRSVTTSTVVHRVDPMLVRYEESAWLFDGDVAMVYGAVTPEAESVEVRLDGVDGPDRSFDAHVFEGYDSKSGSSADYFLAFVPDHMYGLVVAHDAEGNEVDTAVMPQR